MTTEAEKCWNCGCPSMSYQRAHSENSIAETASRAALDALAVEVKGLASEIGMTHGKPPGGELLTRADVLALIAEARR